MALDGLLAGYHGLEPMASPSVAGEVARRQTVSL